MQQVSKLTQYARYHILGSHLPALMARGASGILLLNLVGQALAFVLQLLLARTLGVEQFGIYAYPLGWIGLAVLLASFRLDTVLLRFVAAYRSAEQWELLHGLFQWSNRTVTLLSGILVALSLLVTFLLRDRLGNDLFLSFVLSWLSIPVLALTKLRQAALRSLKFPIIAQLPDSILRPGLIVGIVLLIHARSTSPLSAPVAMGINLGASLAAFALGTWWLQQRFPAQAKKSAVTLDVRQWTFVALPLMAVSGTDLILQSSDKILIGALVGTTPAGIYAVASRLTAVIIFGLEAINIIVAPMIVELFESGRKRELQRVSTLAVLGIFVYTASTFVVFVFAGRFVLHAFGKEFVAGYPALVILLAGQLTNAWSGSSGMLMLMTGHQNNAAKILGVVSVANVLLNLVLIPWFGIVGAAAVSAFVLAARNIAMVLYVQKHLQIDPSILSLFRRAPQ